MKKFIAPIVIATLVAACGFQGSQTTGEPGISYGMSKQRVTNLVSRKNSILSSSENTIVAEGRFIHGQRARKEFVFQDGRLVAVNYKIL